MKKFLPAILTVIFLLLFLAGVRKISGARSYEYDFDEFALENGVVSEDGSIHFDGMGRQLEGLASVVSILREGTYYVRFHYEASEDNQVLVQANHTIVYQVALPSSETTVETSFTLDAPTDRCKMTFQFQGNGTLRIVGMSISSDKLLYTDGFLYLMMLGVAYIASMLFYYQVRIKDKWQFSKSQYITAVFLLALVVISSLPVFTNEVLMGVDTRGHLMRLEGFRGGLAERQLPVIIAPNYCNEFGELACVYPGLFLYPFALLRLFGVSLSAVYRIMLFCINVVTAFGSFWALSTIIKDRWLVLSATAIYVCMPYRLYTMYRAGAAGGMGIAMVFLPIFLVGLYHILLGDQYKKKWYMMVIGCTGIFESHLLTVLCMVSTAIIVFLYSIRNLFAKKRLAALMKAIGFTILINLFALVPMVRYLLTPLNTSALVLPFMATVLSVGDMLTSIRFITNIILIMSAFFLLWKRRKEKCPLLMFARCLLWIGIGSTIMMTELFPWQQLMRLEAVDSMLNMLQFSHRLYIVSAPTLLISCFIGLAECDRQKPVFLVCLVAGLFSFVNIAYGCFEYAKCDPLLNQVAGNINSRNQEEYLPAGTKTSYYETAVARTSDDAVVESIFYQKNGTRVQYQYRCTSENQYLEVPLFYYEGYHAFDDTGATLLVEKGMENWVRVYLPKTLESKNIQISFSVAWYIHLALVISLATVAGGTVYLFISATKWQQKRR